MRSPLDHLTFWLLGTIWGTNFLSMKIAVQVISPMQVAWLRVLFGVLPILAFGAFRRALRPAHLRYSLHFAVMALVSTVIPYVGFVKGTQHLNSGAAGAISGTIPLLTAFIAAALLPGDRLTARRLGGLVLGLVGVGLVAQVDRAWGAVAGTDPHEALRGALYMLAGSAGYAGGMVYARRFLSPLNLGAVALATYQNAFGAVILTALVPLAGIGAIFDHPPALLALAVGTGLLGTGVAFILYYHLIARAGVAAASSVFYVPPVVALVVGSALAHEAIALSQYLGGAVILAGVYLARNQRP